MILNRLPKLVITDIDGVWTDGLMHYSELGNELKSFNVKDGWGVKFLKINKIPLAIMTGESSRSVESRAEKLSVDYLYLGVDNKLSLAKKLCHDLEIGLNDVAFIGDELNDYCLLKSVGYSACPSNAADEVKLIVDKVLQSKGGEGVFREFVVLLLQNAGYYNETIKKSTESCNQ